MSDQLTVSPVVLEPAAQAFTDATADPPYLFDLGPVEGRKLVDEAQSGPIDKPDVDIEDTTVSGGPSGDVSVRIMRPKGVTGTLPAVIYLHGGGWVLGNSHTHDRLIRELRVGADAAVVFPRYGPSLVAQLLFYPITNASFDTDAYREFATGYFLRRDAMRWFWDQYTTEQAQRDEITASPLRASTERLAGLPPALVITGEADVLRDEGEAYGRKLRAAGIDVTATRYEGVIHDFVMLNALRETHGAGAAISQAIGFLGARLGA